MAKKPMDYVGQVVFCRPMTDEELAHEGWEIDFDNPRPIVLVLGNGDKLYPSCDGEGNGPGVLFGISKDGKSFILGPNTE